MIERVRPWKTGILVADRQNRRRLGLAHRRVCMFKDSLGGNAGIEIDGTGRRAVHGKVRPIALLESNVVVSHWRSLRGRHLGSDGSGKLGGGIVAPD